MCFLVNWPSSRLEVGFPSPLLDPYKEVQVTLPLLSRKPRSYFYILFWAPHSSECSPSAG